MKMKMFVSAVVMGFGLVVSAVACPPSSKAGDSAKAPCGKAAQAAAVTAPSHTGAMTVAAKVDDGRSEASSKEGCGKNCTKDCCKKMSPPCHKGAVTVAAKVDDTPTATKAKGGCGKDCKGNCTKDCCKKKASAIASGQSAPCSKSASEGCPIAKKVKAILASLPAMKYRVGDEVTSCSKSAATIAEKSGQPLKYVVGDDVLDKEEDAAVKLTTLLEREAEAMQSIRFVAGGKCGRCPATAKGIAKKAGTAVTFRVGGVDFEKKEDAEKAVKLVRDAVAKVAMTYKVDGKSCGCSKAAGAKCPKTTGAKVTSVSGEGVCCKTSAALMLAEAKVRKIVEIAAAASFSL